MLGFFFRHYDDIVERYVVFDDGSTDDSLELLRAHPRVDLRSMPPYADPDSRVRSGQALQEHCWKESRGAADWVIVTDVDEHLYHPNLASYLAGCLDKGVTAIPSLGYRMLAEEFPQAGVRLSERVVRGQPTTHYSKMNIFSPDAIEATNYGLGRHTAQPLGRVVLPPRDELILLHFRYLGFERTHRRHQEYLTRQRAKDLENGWGIQYSWSREKLREVWDGISGGLIDVVSPDLRPWETHPGPRWWTEHPRVS